MPIHQHDYRPWPQLSRQRGSPPAIEKSHTPHCRSRLVTGNMRGTCIVIETERKPSRFASFAAWRYEHSRVQTERPRRFVDSDRQPVNQPAILHDIS